MASDLMRGGVQNRTDLRGEAAGVLDALGQSVVVTDLDRRVIHWNAAAERLFGWMTDQAVGAPLTELLARDLLPEVEAELVATVGAGKTFERAVDLRRRDGTVFPARVTLTPLRDASGQVTGIIGVAVDLTDLQAAQHRAEKRATYQATAARLARSALEHTELDELFDDAVATVAEQLDAPLCKVLELDPDGTVLHLRAGVGWDEGLVGQASVPVDHGSQAGYTLVRDQPIVVTDLATEARFTAPRLLVDHDVAAGMSIAIPGLHGRFGVLGVHSREPRAFDSDDIAFLETIGRVLGGAVARHQLEQTAQLWQTTVEHLPAGLTIWDGTDDPHDTGTYRLVAMNPAAETMFTRPRDQVLGRTTRDMDVNHDIPAFVGRAVWRSRNRGEVVELPIHQMPGLYGDRWVHARTFPLPPHGLVGIALDDVSDLHQLEAARLELLEQALHVAEDERHRLAEHLHDDAIQLLAAIDFRVQTLRRRVHEADLEPIAELIGQTANALRRIVLEFHPPEMTATDLQPTVEAYARRLLPPAGVAMSLTVTLPDDLDPQVVTATYRLLVEALSNVARHARAAHVDVDLQVHEGRVLGQVVDDGQGINDDASTGPGHLGLRAMRDRVALLRGHVTVERAQPHGTAVRFDLPVQPDR